VLDTHRHISQHSTCLKRRKKTTTQVDMKNINGTRFITHFKAKNTTNNYSSFTLDQAIVFKSTRGHKSSIEEHE